MKTTTPKVYILSGTQTFNYRQSPLPDAYEKSIGLSKPWTTNAQSDGEALVEAAGRICYKSWEPGINPNVTRVREGNEAYLSNILEQRHGSVLEHVNVTFLFHNVSRVFTHELVRHRVGVAISQESLRYVRLDENSPVVLPPDIAELVMEEAQGGNNLGTAPYTEALGAMLRRLVDHYGLDDPKTSFKIKKTITSAMRRFLGMGVATDMVWTANIRTLRHCLEMRSDAPGVEWEMLEVFGRQVGPLITAMYPALFQDFVQLQDDSWCTYHRARALQVLNPKAEHIVKSGNGYVDWLNTDNEKMVSVPEKWVKGWCDRMKGNA